MGRDRKDPECRRCASPFTQRVARRGPFEHLISAAFVYPFRCSLCASRFLALQWGVRYRKRAIDRRQFVRMQVHIPANLGAESGVVTDLSLGGCSIETRGEPPVGRVLELGLRLPDEPPLVVDAAVVRSATAPNVNLEFLRMSDENRARLRRTMERLTRAASSPRPGG